MVVLAGLGVCLSCGSHPAASENPTAPSPLARLFSVQDSLGPFETGFWAGKTPWIAANRAALVDLCEDMILFRKWAYDPKTAPQARALLAKLGKRPVEDYANVFTDKDTLHRDPKLFLDAANIQKNLRDLNEAGALKLTIEAKNYVDMSLAREAAARIAQK